MKEIKPSAKFASFLSCRWFSFETRCWIGPGEEGRVGDGVEGGRGAAYGGRRRGGGRVEMIGDPQSEGGTGRDGREGEGKRGGGEGRGGEEDGTSLAFEAEGTVAEAMEGKERKAALGESRAKGDVRE